MAATLTHHPVAPVTLTLLQYVQRAADADPDDSQAREHLREVSEPIWFQEHMVDHLI
jgi:hypothetical protein